MSFMWGEDLDAHDIVKITMVENTHMIHEIEAKIKTDSKYFETPFGLHSFRECILELGNTYGSQAVFDAMQSCLQEILRDQESWFCQETKRLIHQVIIKNNEWIEKYYYQRLAGNPGSSAHLSDLQFFLKADLVKILSLAPQQHSDQEKTLCSLALQVERAVQSAFLEHTIPLSTLQLFFPNMITEKNGVPSIDTQAFILYMSAEDTYFLEKDKSI